MVSLNPNDIVPHGGELKNLIVDTERKKKIKEGIYKLKSWDLKPSQLYDLELLLNGGFSPLDGYLYKEDYDSVVEGMRLSNGILWPIPIVLDVTKEFAEEISEGDRIALRDPEGLPLAVMEIRCKWEPDKNKEAEKVYGTLDRSHHGVFQLQEHVGTIYLGGPIEGLEYPQHYCFKDIRHTPEKLRKIFQEKGWNKIVAFQTRNPMHRAHFELTLRACEDTGAGLLIHPVVGITKPGDINYYTRVRCYKKLTRYYQEEPVISLLPLAMRMAGPREALWHAIIRKNYGCTHFIIGRDHAGPGNDSNGNNFYGHRDAQRLALEYEKDLGIKIIPFDDIVYVQDKGKYLLKSEMPEGGKTLSISGTELNYNLKAGLEIPEWFSFPEVIEELRKAHPERKKQGFTIFFTGLSGAGKSTIARALYERLMENGGRPVTLLDGDIVRKNISNELGFSKEHRNININRIGFVASEITKNRGIAICAPIAPYDSVRRDVRRVIEEYGGFILVYVSTPLEVCEMRDRKGLYAKARKGIIKDFTGINDPYEEPMDAELNIDTTDMTPEESVEVVMDYLHKCGFTTHIY